MTESLKNSIFVLPLPVSTFRVFNGSRTLREFSGRVDLVAFKPAQAGRGDLRVCRSADDIADEGDFRPEERLAALSGYIAELDTIERNGHPDSKLFIDLKQVIGEFRLPLAPFRNLLAAFIQDISTKRYETYDDLLDYCRLSANPVGLLMLHLYEAATEENKRMSDAICTSLPTHQFLAGHCYRLEKRQDLPAT